VKKNKIGNKVKILFVKSMAYIKIFNRDDF